MIYRVALGWNVPLVSLAALVPQPQCPGLMYADEQPAADGSVYRAAPYFLLNYSAFDSIADMAALFTQLGLHDSDTEAVTITGPNKLYAETRYNALVVFPFIGQDGQRRDFFLRDFSVIVKSLAALA